MIQTQRIFNRVEKKYLLDKRQYAALRDRLGERARPDQYGMQTICNLYFDTDDYELIRSSLDKPVYKEKLRLRSYGVPDEGSIVYLELKKKFKGVVYKRRAGLLFSQAARFQPFHGDSGENLQILNEINWFIEFYRPKPKVFLAYDRVALYGREEPELRVTFDLNIRWRETELDLLKGDWGAPLLDTGRILMEIKFFGAMPLWLCQTLSELHIYPAPFSKYGVCYREYLSRGAGWTGGVTCA